MFDKTLGQQKESAELPWAPHGEPIDDWCHAEVSTKQQRTCLTMLVDIADSECS